MKEPKTESTTGRASVPASPDQPIPEADLSAASAKNKRRQRQDALDEAAKICGDLRNSIEAIGAFAITGHVDVVRQHYTIYVDRAKNLHAILAAQIENLPEL
jgi:hypothetical protein